MYSSIWRNRADERYQLWRMFENRRHPTPPPKGDGLTPADGILRSHDLRPLRPPPRPIRSSTSALPEAGLVYFQDFYGLEPTPPESREARPPPIMSQGGFTADRGFVPTDDELASAVSMEHLANLVADRARAATGQGEEFSEAEPEEEDPHAAPSRSRSRR